MIAKADKIQNILRYMSWTPFHHKTFFATFFAPHPKIFVFLWRKTKEKLSFSLVRISHRIRIKNKACYLWCALAVHKVVFRKLLIVQWPNRAKLACSQPWLHSKAFAVVKYGQINQYNVDNAQWTLLPLLGNWSAKCCFSVLEKLRILCWPVRKINDNKKATA